MKRSSRGSERGKVKPKVRNKLIIGDSKPAFMVRPEAHQSIASRTVTKSNMKFLNNRLADLGGKIRLADGSKFDRNIRATGDRAKAVYGSTKKAMKHVYNIDSGTDKRRKARTTKGSMKVKARDKNTSGTNSIGQVFSPERPRSRRRKRTLI